MRIKITRMCSLLPLHTSYVAAFLDHMAEINQTNSAASEATIAATRSMPVSTTSPVERKKNAAGRRKLTPHPLNANKIVAATSEPFDFVSFCCFFWVKTNIFKIDLFQPTAILEEQEETSNGGSCSKDESKPQ